MIKKIILTLLFLGLLIAVKSSQVKADISFPTENVVYFTLDGKPYNKPVDFKIVCYGYTFPLFKIEEKQPGTYRPAEVYSWSASCPSYGCRIDKSHYLNGRHIDYCNLYGKTEGLQFTIERFNNSPAQNCQPINSKDFMQRCILNFEILSRNLVEEKTLMPFSFPMVYEHLFIWSLLLTIIVETLVLFLLIRFFSKNLNITMKIIDIIGVGIVSSALTLPYLWFVLPSLFISLPYPFSLLTTITGELLAVLVESYLLVKFLKIPKKYAFFFSLIVNVFSFLYGKLGLL